ncbi:MAG: amidinotransferase [Alphaproteobacteria bacterium]|nr:amidinotransferase [Alphaproteobacteria bacterium]MDE2266222.1 amidinotransferase [Alphaproteobacteria bacterium]
MSRKPTLLVIDAGHFEVSYVINPWMTPDAWSKDRIGHFRAAQTASAALEQALVKAGAEVIRLPGAAGLPDMVFPANAAVVLDGRALVARFRYPERQGEERLFLKALEDFKARGLLEVVEQYPAGCFQEGAGDCIWDATRQHFWAGYGQRSIREAIAVTEEFFDVPVVPLELASPRFYHLDTCFLALSGGEIVYYPPAFTKEALATIRDAAPKEKLIEASDEDAAGFCVNAVNMGRQIVMAQPRDGLRAILSERGYTVTGVDLSPFIMAGGGAYCMTLRLDRARAADAQVQRAAQ